MAAPGPSLTNCSAWPMSGIGPKAEVDDHALVGLTLATDFSRPGGFLHETVIAGPYDVVISRREDIMAYGRAVSRRTVVAAAAAFSVAATARAQAWPAKPIQ